MIVHLLGASAVGLADAQALLETFPDLVLGLSGAERARLDELPE